MLLLAVDPKLLWIMGGSFLVFGGIYYYTGWVPSFLPWLPTVKGKDAQGCGCVCMGIAAVLFLWALFA